jgi:hypothetical protein
MEDTKEINGRNTDSYCRGRIADIASNLCPAQDNTSRMTYADLILEWVMCGETSNARYARTQSIERAYQNRITDVAAIGVGMDRSMTWPEFRREAETMLRFIGGES